MCDKSPFQIDLEKYYVILCKTKTPTFSKKMRLLMLNMGLHCIAVYRFGQAVKRLQKRHRVIGRAIRILYLLMNQAILLVHKVELNAGSEIGPGFHISHVGNIFIGRCKIGANCTVTHNVTLGQGFEAAGSGVPTIGNRVWIGTGSVITGGVTIGDGATISAGAILTRSIPANCLVAGNPARLISKEYDNRRMIVYEMDGRSRHVTEPKTQTAETSA